MIALTGSGIGPANIVVNPISIDFGNIKRGATSAPRTVTVSNTGGAGLAISSVKYPGAPFNVVGDTCTGVGTLAPGGTCEITIVFNPTRAVLYGPYYLTINSNDPDTPQAKVSLKGRGTY